jgi:hypothetical protein
MSQDYSIGIAGIQQVQQETVRLMAAAKPSGKFGQAIWLVTQTLHRYAVTITHVVTGSLRAAHRERMIHDEVGFIWIDSSAINPMNHAKPSVYGFYEEQRGGAHAFYKRTVDERSASAVNTATRSIFG